MIAGQKKKEEGIVFAPADNKNLPCKKKGFTFELSIVEKF